MRIERDHARFMVDVMDALATVKSGVCSYGEFHLGDLPIMFDGDPSGFYLAFSDGAYWIADDAVDT